MGVRIRVGFDTQAHYVQYMKGLFAHPAMPVDWGTDTDERFGCCHEPGDLIVMGYRVTCCSELSVGQL